MILQSPVGGVETEYTMKFRTILLALTLAPTLGCGNAEDNNDTVITINNENNANNDVDMGGENTTDDAGNNDEPDIPTFGDVGDNPNNDDGCDEAGELIDAWPLNNAVSSGAVTAMNGTATLDASAGGTAAAAGNPFVYFDLDGGAKVDVTDHEAVRTDTTWDIAFRRTAAFINGGDAGPGAVEIARLTGVTFDAVMAADVPADSEFVTEDPVDADCQVLAPPSGFGSVLSVFEQLNPDTTSGSWFNYSMGGAGPSVTAYDDHVYIIRGTDGGATFKFSFVSWDSGELTVQWAEL